MTAVLKSIQNFCLEKAVALACALLFGGVIYYGGFYFVTHKEFVPVQQAVQELVIQTNTAAANQQIIVNNMAHIRESLVELKMDIRDLRNKK